MKLSQVLLLSLVITSQVSAIYPPVEKDPSIDSDELVTIQKLTSDSGSASGSESGSKDSIGGLKKADSKTLKNTKLIKGGKNEEEDEEEEDEDDSFGLDTAKSKTTTPDDDVANEAEIAKLKKLSAKKAHGSGHDDDDEDEEEDDDDDDDDKENYNRKGLNKQSSSKSIKEFEKSEKSKNAFFLSVSMIFVSEIGDKTFLVAALMSMKHPRMIVFSAAFSALVIMTILSGLVGHALPSLLPHRFTQFLAAVLFFVFSYNLTKEGLSMDKNAGVGDEMAEVEEEIEAVNLNDDLSRVENANVNVNANDNITLSKDTIIEKAKEIYKNALSKSSNLIAFMLTPIWVQTFAMTFLGEWGDRSQIATIAMAAGSDYWLVILGGIVGHGICTAGAVIGGKMLAAHISMRNVTLGGAAAFFIFAIMYLYSAYYNLD
ncbi:hypothetical protein B5S31_g1048 [[Candida] boidinii]|nr:hypothetical protein B5S29_g997 [[Candida] boidinii]OWB71362.1 hypothetical protein B5S31_g1048 [[Candida] boidinii]OWB76985.1 hypothetical protein B5S32_g1142 [[Candida] boidinii]